MPTIKYSTDEVHQWRDKAWRLRLKRRLSINKICHLIGEEFGVPPHSVAYRVFGLGRPNHDRTYGRGYRRNYRAFTRRLDSLLPQLYNGNTELSLAEMSERIETHSGIRMQEGTLENLLGKYEGNAPLVKTESGKYQLNQNFYQTK
jgi:hypothetical protein